MLKALLTKLLDGESLDQTEAKQAADSIMDGQATSSLIAGFLVALRMKGETACEVAGFVESMRAHSMRIQLKDSHAVDGVGTGGDGAHSFNISTASAIVAAGAGATVAKHGNRSVSSKCGSADLLEATGGDIDPGVEQVGRLINDIGFGFMFAPRFHPAMKHAMPPRKELGVRTVFNILGPMTNPAGVKRLLLGVYSKDLMPLVAEVLALTGTEHAVIVHSQDGLDEVSVCAPTDYLELKDGRTVSGTISPDDCGLPTHPAGALVGGDAVENLSILNSILSGDKSACRDAVIINAGVMLQVAGKADSLSSGAEAAAEAIDSGQAREKLDRWVALSRS
jgi:anthranilate phosphoribosyltransferase